MPVGAATSVADMLLAPLKQIGDVVVRRGIGWFIAAATERTRNSERAARMAEERAARIRNAVQVLGDALLYKAANSGWSSGQYTTVDLSREALSAVTTLSMEYPELIEDLGTILRYTDKAQPLDARYALTGLMVPVIRAAAPALSCNPTPGLLHGNDATALGPLANADAATKSQLLPHVATP